MVPRHARTPPGTPRPGPPAGGPLRPAVGAMAAPARGHEHGVPQAQTAPAGIDLRKVPDMNLLKPLNLLTLLPWRRATTAAQVASTFQTAAHAAGEQEGPKGCGWFDSSHDLQQGLCVQEHLAPDALAREPPLAAWLELQLSGWHAAQPA